MDPIYAAPARIHLRASYGDLLRLAQEKHALDPTILDETPPFFFDAEASSNRLDAYFTRMAPSSLRQYAADADEGRAFQNSHRWMELPLGRTLNAQYEDLGEGLARMVTSVYVVPGLNLNGVQTSDFIRAVRAGIVSDVSIGFSGGRFRCSICGQDLMGADCPHIPGFEYDTQGTDGEVRREVAFAWIDDARLSEVSAVYDGATPGAAILKATQEAEAGRLMPDKARVLEARYRIHLPGARHLVPGAMYPKEDKMLVSFTHLDDARALLAEEGEQGDVDLAEWVRTMKQAQADLGTLRAHVAVLTQSVEDLTPWAEMGRAYRADLIDETLQEGVRAFGAAFPLPTFRTLLEAQDLTAIKAMRDYHAAIAAQTLTGGRKSADTADPAPTGETATPPAPAAAPDHVYQA